MTSIDDRFKFHTEKTQFKAEIDTFQKVKFVNPLSVILS